MIAGLTVSHGKKFKQVVKEPFCISGAALEPVDPNTGKYDGKRDYNIIKI